MEPQGGTYFRGCLPKATTEHSTSQAEPVFQGAVANKTLDNHSLDTAEVTCTHQRISLIVSVGPYVVLLVQADI